MQLGSVLLCAALVMGAGASSVYAQTGTVIGDVLDADSGEPLAGVTVSIQGTDRSTTSTSDGRFMIRNVPAGNHVVVASMLGYGELRSEVNVSANQTRRLEIRMSVSAMDVGGIMVTANRRYAADRTGTALMIEADIQDIPQSVQIVTNDFLEDQNVGRLDDVFRNVSGTTSFSDYQDYTIRGFRTQDITYNGMTANPNHYFSSPKMTNVERVEVLKGPAAILIGTFEAGGFVNIVTKEPRASRHMRAAATLGSFDERRLGIDVGGPLDADGTYLYRLSADVEDSGDFRRFQHHTNTQIAPAFTWVASENTSVTLKGEYTYDEQDGGRDRGIAAPEGDTEALPIDWTVNEPNDVARNEGHSIETHFKQDLNDNWNSHVLARYSDGTFINKYHEPRPFFVGDAGNLMMQRQYRDQTFNSEMYVASARLIGDVQTWGMLHKLVFGGEYSREVLDNERNYATVVPPIDVFNPTYTSDPSTYDFNNVGTFGGDVSQVSMYVQDLLQVIPQVHVLGGIRYTSLRQYSFSNDRVTMSEFGAQGTFSPRFGVVYQPVEQMSVYGSYSQGFQPQALSRQNEESGGPFDPVESRQVELGAKAGFFNNRLVATTSVYQLEKVNQLQRDLTAEFVRYILYGEVRSRGFEMDLIGAPMPNWSTVANYSYNEIEVTRHQNEDNIGNTFPNAPKHSASIWSRFDIPGTSLGVGAGANYVGDRETFTDLLILPAYTVFDAALYYEWRLLDFQLNVRNLTDKRYFSGGYNDFTLWPGAPRWITFRVGVEL